MTDRLNTIYGRALFDYDPATDSGLPGKGIPFRYGDVLYVTNASGDDWWQAQKVMPEEGDAIGIIPSKERQVAENWKNNLSSFYLLLIR